MRISIGNGGWVAVDDLGLPGPLYVRMREQGGRLRVAEFYLDASQGEEAIDARDLRDLPFTQLEAFINMWGAGGVSPRLDGLAPDLSTLATHYATGFGQVGKQIAAGNWVAASFVAQRLAHDGVRRAVVRNDEYLSGKDAERALEVDPSLPWVQNVKRGARPTDWQGLRESEREFRLASGPAEGLTDEFLQELAKAYRAAVARGERPNVAIQEQTGYPLKTVQRWVYTARQRGIMPKGTKGKVG